MNKENRLLVIGSDGVWQKDDKFFTSSPFNTFFAAFNQDFSSIRMALPLLPPCDSDTAVPIPDGIIIVSLPGFTGVVDFIKKSPLLLPRLIIILREEIKSADAIMVMHDDFLGILAIAGARKLKKAHLLFLGGDQIQVVSHKYQGWKRWLAMRLARFFERIDEYWLDKGTLVLVTGTEMLNRLSGNGRPIFPYFTCLVSEADIIEPASQKVFPGHANILYVGFLNQNKGIDILLRAFAKYRIQLGMSLKLHIVGLGPARPVLEALSKSLQIDNNVVFHGFIGDKTTLSNIYRHCDLFVLPSRSEGIPKVLLEAMGHGIPILTTNVGGIPDIIQTGINGIMVPPDDVNALGEGIITILTNINFRKKLATGGNIYIRDHTMEAQSRDITRHLFREGKAFSGNV
jgi:glycosyltransferase involved in cell wall biosynthesis